MSAPDSNLDSQAPRRPAPQPAATSTADQRQPQSLLLRDATLADGGRADVLLHAGEITAVGRAASTHPHAAHAAVLDLTGYLLVPSAAEPHAHLDKAMLGDRIPNLPQDLAGAIEAVRRAYPAMAEQDIADRARQALAVAVSHGYTAIRTHATCEAGIGARALRALCALRDECAELADLQVVAMIGTPVTGRAGASQRALLTECVQLGADAIGGAPALDDHPGQALRILASAAASAGLPIDLHLDETTDAGVLTLKEFVAEVERLGLAGRATASHCVSLGQQDPAVAADLAARLAAAGVGVVTLPQTNLFLQGRGQRTRVPRGLTAVGALRDAGVVLAGGGDNWRDPFNPLGRIDPLETAGLLVTAAHVGVGDAYAAVSAQARQIMGLAEVTIAAGAAADLLAIRAASLGDAMATADPSRWVFRRGRLVSRTRMVTEVDPAAWLDPPAPGKVRGRGQRTAAG